MSIIWDIWLLSSSKLKSWYFLAFTPLPNNSSLVFTFLVKYFIAIALHSYDVDDIESIKYSAIVISKYIFSNFILYGLSAM